MAELHLGDVDVEAQKAILADIERRKRDEDQRGRRCERQYQNAGGARREARTPGGTTPSRPTAYKRHKAPRSSAAQAAASRPDSSDGHSAGWAVGVKPQARTAAAAAPKPSEGGGGFEGQQVFPVDDDDENAGSCSPMDIRDFFARRG